MTSLFLERGPNGNPGASEGFRSIIKQWIEGKHWNQVRSWSAGGEGGSLRLSRRREFTGPGVARHQPGNSNAMPVSTLTA